MQKKPNGALSPCHPRTPRRRVEYTSHEQPRDERRSRQRDEPAKVDEGDEARVDAAPVAVCEADADRRAGDALCCLVPLAPAQRMMAQARGRQSTVLVQKTSDEGERGEEGGISPIQATQTSSPPTP